MLSKLLPYLTLASISIGAALPVHAATLQDLTARGELQLTAFIDAYRAPAPPTNKLPAKTISQLKSDQQERQKETVYRPYKLATLVAAKPTSVELLLAKFDGTSAAENSVDPAPAPEPDLRIESTEPVAADLTVTAPPTSKKASVARQENIVVKVTEPKQEPKLVKVQVEPQTLVKSTTRQPLTIVVKSREDVSFEPTVLTFDRKTNEADVQIVDGSGAVLGLSAETSLFVRNEDVLGFDATSQQLRAKAEGETEVYFVHKGKVHVLPAFVKQHASTPDLEVPSELFALSELNLNPHHTNQASMKLGEPAAGLRPPPSADAAASAPELVEATISNEIFATSRPARYVTARLKVVDQRSAHDETELFPLPRVSVSIAGLDYKGLTDRLGTHHIENIPSHSRLVLKFDDPLGRVRSMVKEVQTGEGDAPLDIDVEMPLNRVISTFEQVAGIVPNMNLATVCGIAYATRTEQQTMAGLEVNLDVPGEGPYYFNRFGYLDAAQGLTGDDGKFCFFNVEPGPVAISFFDNGAFLSTQVLSAHAGRYQHFDIFLTDPVETAGHLAARVTAHEQLGGDRRLARSHRLIDMIDVVPLGTGQSMTYLDEGFVGVVGGADLQNGRAMALAQASEFEPVLYQLQGGTDNVLPLLPRGFIDDMSIYAQVPYYPDLGVVVAEHGDLTGQGDQTVEMRLENLAGEQVGEGWYYDDKPTTKAIFFNLPPGQYVLMVETQDGYWLAADTVFVFNETVSYIRTGSQLRRR